MASTQITGSKRNRWKTAAITLWVSLAIALAAACTGAQSLAINLGFDGAFVHGRWSPVRIDVSAGAEPFSGHVEIEIPRTTLLSVEPTYVTLTAPVAVQSRETKRLWLSVPLHAAPYPMIGRLVNAAGKSVVTQEIALREGAAQKLALVLDPSGERWSWLFQGDPGGAATMTTRAARNAAEVPSDAVVLSSLTAIIIKDDFPLDSLTPGQLTALLDYVRYGGHLVLTGGSTPPSIPRALADGLPFLPTGRIVPLQTDAAIVPAWELDAPPHASVRLFGEVPLTVTGSVGEGQVTYVAVNPASPVSRSLLSIAAWNSELIGDDGRNWPSTSLGHQEELWRILGRARFETRPPLTLVLTLSAYAALVTAALWIARRRPAALLVVALLICGFSIATSIVATLHSVSNRTAYAELQIAQAIGPGVLQSRTYGIVASGSPVPMPFQVSAAAPPPFPAGTGRTSIEASVTPDGIRFSEVQPGQTVRFVHETLEPLSIVARIEQGDGSHVRVQNNGDSPLHFAYVVGRDWFAPLGTIEKGAAVSSPVPRSVEGTSSFVTLSIQSHLERLSSRERPTSLEARIIAFSVGQALDDPAYSGRRDVPLLVALVEPSDSVRVDSAGSSVRRRVIIAPFVEDVVNGGGHEI